MAAFISLFFLFVTLLHDLADGRGLAGSSHDKVIVCYVSRWSVYRPGAGSFDIFDIEPSLCTHLIYCFVGLDQDTFKITNIDPYQDLEINDGKGGFKRIIALKEKHKHLKVSIGIGGWNEGSAKYSKMAADPKLRNIFVRSVMNFLEQYKFDGLDLNWDYPTQRGGKPEDRKNYVHLIRELSEAFEPYGFLLTAALRPGKDDMNTVYDLTHVNYYLDFMHIMTYDYHGAWDGVVGANAPIRGQYKDDIYSIEYTINYLLSHGLTPSKMVFGLPMYGRTYWFTSRNVKDIIYGETTTKTTGFQGQFSKEDGFMGYNEICLEISNKSSLWTQHWEEHTSTPYIRDEERFITYDNPRSIANKVKFAMDRGLGGFSAWSIVTDDFRGSCDEEPDTYKDYIDRFNKISDQTLLKDALISLTESETENQFYVISDKKVRLRLPKPSFANYPLLRTVNEAIFLATEEKRVLDEMEKIKTHRRNELEKGSSPCIRTCTEVCFYGL
ncbi:probable chitinase 2 [Vanessa cardui]|uniref:probable chitinase 2 n=1 Tax=Vanessa cardui TaxID=171605 RepID=UPI001F13ABBD|nr:probable chitinase 2 [Vanessa cardui]